MWKQKSTAQAIVVPCSAEDSLALGGRNGYNIPAVQKILLHRADRSPVAGGGELALPAAAVLFCFLLSLYHLFTGRATRIGPIAGVLGKVFNLAFNRQECPRWTFLLFWMITLPAGSGLSSRRISSATGGIRTPP